MVNIYIKPRCGFGEITFYKTITGVEWSYQVIPHLKDINHKKFVVNIPEFDEYTDEYCPCCDTEVVIPSFGVSFCPNCGELILPCSMCDSDYNDCRECPYEKWTKQEGRCEND